MKTIQLITYQGNMYFHYQLRTYLYYTISIVTLPLLLINYLAPTLFLIICGLLIIYAILFIYTVFAIETQKKKYKILLRIDIDSIRILNTQNEIIQEFNDIESMNVYFDSYFGRKATFSLSFEMGYNRLFILDNKQVKSYFLFTIKDRPAFYLLKENFTLLKDKSTYQINLFNRKC